MVGLVIGKNGETIKSINSRTGAYVFIAQVSNPPDPNRSISITGYPANCERAKQEVLTIV